MSKLPWSIALAIYVATMIAFHRFEKSEHALLILGNIPSLLTAIFTLLALFIASLTYFSNKKREPSKEYYGVYKEALNGLVNILKSKDYDKSYKLYYISLTYESLSKIEKFVTENDHKAGVSTSLVMVKHEIETFLRGIKINEYFSIEKRFEEEYSFNVTSSADALYKFWLENVSGKSSIFIMSDKNHDFFASYPFGLDEVYLTNALALCAVKDFNLSCVKNNIESMLKKVETTGYNELIHLSEKLPTVIAYLLLKNQTIPSKFQDGKPTLKLTTSFSDKFWISYQMKNLGWVRYNLPSVIKL